MNNTFNKTEKLKSLNAFKALFAGAESCKHYPIRMVFMPYTNEVNAKVQVGFSVTKKRFKRAVDRNQIKRQMREAYRLNKAEVLTELQQQYAVLFIYLHHQKSPYNGIEEAIKKCIADLFIFDSTKMKS